MPTHFSLDSGPIAVLTLHSSNQMNLLQIQAMEKLCLALEQAAQQSDIQVLMITGGGSKAFCAGADMRELLTLQDVPSYVALGEKLMQMIACFPVPVIAAINGYALGAGFSLATACEFRIMSETAKIGQVAVRNGLIPPFGDIPRLTHIVGHTKARELVYTGHVLSATEALACGLVSHICLPDALMQTAQAFASQMQAGPRFVITTVKGIFNHMTTDVETTAKQAAALASCLSNPHCLDILRSKLAAR